MIKVSQLPEDINPTSEDVVLTVDNESGSSKKVKLGNLSKAIYSNPPQGHMINGKIVTSVTSGNLTVAIKTLAGNDPSTSDPIYVRIGNTVRTLTTAKTWNYGAGTAVFNSSSLELQNQEVDYFVYLVWDSTLGIQVGASRIPYARTVSDFTAGVNTEKFCDLAYAGYLAGTIECENIGRFNVILSDTNQWSIPATSIIINRPIFQTRQLSYKPIWTAQTTNPVLGNGILTGTYQIRMNMCHINIRYTAGSTTTYGSGFYQWSLPMVYGQPNLYQLMSGSGIYYNGTSFALTPHNNYFFGGVPVQGVSFTTSKDSVTQGVSSPTNPTTWANGAYFGLSWLYNII